MTKKGSAIGFFSLRVLAPMAAMMLLAFLVYRVIPAYQQCSDFGANTVRCFVNDTLTGEDL